MIFGLLDHVNLAATLNSSGRFDEAINACKLGLNLGRRRPELLAQIGRAALGLERGAAAIAACEAALRLDPDCRDALLELALARRLTGDSAGGLAAAERALALDPVAEDAHCVRATLLLWDGRFVAGLEEQEWHWCREAELLARRFGNDRAWDGAPDRSVRLLVAHEQGYGDLIFAARYLRPLRESVGRLLLECAPEAAELMRAVPGVDEVIVKGTVPEPGFDRYVRLMSVPRLFESDVAEPAAEAYLRADPALVARWGERLAADGPGVRVGIVWAGNPNHTNDRDRSVAADLFAAFAGVSGVRWYSLQKGPREDDPVPGLNPVRCAADLETFAETAALVASLDLVITVDTATAHLAAALGTPVWLLLGARPDWRWMLEGSRTRWYRKVRLVRRGFGGSWLAVFASLRAELEVSCA